MPPNNTPSPAPNPAPALTSPVDLNSSVADRANSIFQMPSTWYGYTLWPAITSWRILGFMASETVNLAKPIVGWTRQQVNKIVSLGGDVGKTAGAVTIGGITDVAIGAPYYAGKQALKATGTGLGAVLEGVKSAGLTALEAPGVMGGAVLDVVNTTRKAFGLDKLWNFTLGRLPGLQVNENPETHRTQKWLKERWGRFGDKSVAFGKDVLGVGGEVLNSYATWGARVANSGIFAKIRSWGGGGDRVNIFTKFLKSGGEAAAF